MINGLVRILRSLKVLAAWLQRPDYYQLPKFVELVHFLYLNFSLLVLNSLVFLVEVPIHISQQPTTSFVLLAARMPSGEFVDSYYRFYRRYQIAVASVLMFVVLSALQVYLVGVSFYSVGRPVQVLAYTTSVDLTPTWDDTAVKESFYSFSCTPSITYTCHNSSVPTRLVFGRDNIITDCSSEEGNDTVYRSAIKFPTANIPDNATVTKVELIVQVQDAVAQNVNIQRTTSDSPDSWSCAGNSQLFDNLASGSAYASPDWSLIGLKTVELSGTAVADVQNRLTAGSNLGISLTTSEPSLALALGQIESVEGTPDPILRVTYTLPPQAPTGFTSGSHTTTTIPWSWIDNATEETRYDVMSGLSGGSPVTGCTALAANSSSCTETGLSANTQYQRHVNVTDPNGNTDGTPTATLYTSIETPAGVTFNNVSANSITISATGGVSNLTSGTSGLHFRNTVTLDELLWTQTNTWTNSGLGPNTQYGYDIRARNGDADTTGFCSAVNKYTLSATPNIASTQTTSIWYNTASFSFTNSELWGAGGVQYYRYVWNQISTHTFSGSEDTWANLNASCPGGTCTNASTTLNMTASADGNNWYLHVQSFNAEDVANGGGTNYGPYFFDSTKPNAPASVNDGTGSDIDTQTSTSEISANWSAVSDSTSGLQKYQYAIGTTSGGTEVVSYTDNGTATTITRSGLALSNGMTYFVSVRAVDNAGNISSATVSDGVTVNSGSSAGTTISNVQASVLSSSSARITWSTNEAATSRVNYGVTSSYGSFVTNAALTTSHSLDLTSLRPNTTYHYRVSSTGTTTATGADSTFTTAAASTGLPTPTPVLPEVDQLVLTSRPLFTGNALSGNTIFLFVDGMLDSVFKATEHESGVGSYAYQLQHDLGFGYHTFYVLARDDASGLTSHRSPARRFITFPDVPATIFDPVRDAVVNENKVTVTGVAWTTYDVFIFIDKELAGVVKASVGRGGVGDFAFVSGELEPGEHTIHVRMRDQHGQIGLASTIRTFTVQAASP